MVQQIKVENIKCGGCINSIQTALMKIPDVEKISMDIESETITISGNADRNLITDKLNELGYPEKGSNTLLRKAKSYVNCAIGKINQ